jgi:hypothetical protein
MCFLGDVQNNDRCTQVSQQERSGHVRPRHQTYHFPVLNRPPVPRALAPQAILHHLVVRGTRVHHPLNRV